MRTATYWINHLRLTRHPEGGYYRETYRSTESVEPAALPARFQGSRSLSTAIYFLLESSQRSVFHRIKSDEVWHFYDGSPVAIFVLRDGGLDTFRLGLSIENNETPQVTIPANTWFAAHVDAPDSFTLCGCTVSPGFDFVDFEIAPPDSLSREFPAHRSLIDRFTPAPVK